NVLRQTGVTALKKAMHQDTQPQLGLIEPRSTFGRTIALMLRREVAQEGPPLLLVHHTATRQHTARLQWAAKKHLSQRLLAFVAAWNTHAHLRQSSTKSVAKVMAKCESTMAQAA